MLKIGELASKTGLTAHTTRFYEKNGLINACRRSAVGYRHYNDSGVWQAALVRTARRIGFYISDAATLLSIRVNERNYACQDVTDITQRKLRDVDEKISELASMRKTLQILLNSCNGGPEKASHCSIMEALDASNVATARRRVI